MKLLILHPADYKRLKPRSPEYEAEGIKLTEDVFGVCELGFAYLLTPPPERVPMPAFKYLPLAVPPLPRWFGLNAI